MRFKVMAIPSMAWTMNSEIGGARDGSSNRDQTVSRLQPPANLRRVIRKC